MPRASLCGILRRNRRKKRAEGQSATRLTLIARSSRDSGLPSAQGPNLTQPNTHVSGQGQSPITPPRATPCSPTQAAGLETLLISTSENQPVSNAPQTFQPQQERGARSEISLPRPYATSVDLWNEALGQLDESEKRNIESLIGGIDDTSMNPPKVKSLAATVQEQIDMAFKTQEHDSRVDRVIDGALAVLGKFVSAVDVAVSFDPVHAALPWAAVRSVLVLVTSNNELKSQLITGFAIVASLLAQCHTYQQLYMAPDTTLRPPEADLSNLKTFIVQTYAKTQLFLSFADQQQRSRIGPVATPFKLGDAESHVNELSKCEKQLSRAADNCERHCDLSNRSNVRELLTTITDFSKVFQYQIDLVMNQIDSKDRTEMLEWISSVPYGQHHDRVREARTTDTCEWLLKHSKFREWEETSSSTILWLQGSPGAGKTFLASKVVDHRKALLESSPNPEGFAFFYCDRNEEQRRQPHSVLQSYVRQLSTTGKNPNHIRKQLQDLCRKARDNGSKLSFENCREQLLESITMYSQTTLVLDALDECEPKSREKIFEVIEYLISRSGTGLKVFISSRPDRDIRNRFLNTPTVEIQATDNEEDIQKFVRGEIIKHGNWGGMSQDLQHHIVKVLFNKSRGMFQWAFLQINELLGLETQAAIRSRLGRLPDGLKTAYDEIYGKIKDRSKHDRTLVENAFKWVACALRPLKSEELLSAIRLDSDTITHDLSETITESQLLHLCNNLLVIDSQRHVWRFSHLSVTEYFEENHCDLRRAHCHAASVCLKTITETFKNVNPTQIQSEEAVDLQSDNPFERYTLDNWMVHTQAQEGQGADPILAQLLKSFLGSPTNTSIVYRAWLLEAQRTMMRYDIYELAPNNIALFAMCGFSFYHILLDWWKDAEFDVSVTNHEGYNLLALAAMAGCKPICENLVKRGIEVNMQLTHRIHGSVLIAAADKGQTDIIKFLVNEAGADVDLKPQNGTHGSALAAAVFARHLEVVKFLVHEAGANVDMQLEKGNHGSVLAGAVFACHFEVVKFLVHEAGADVNMQLENERACSALAAAIWVHNSQTVEFLLKSGADVNMRIQNGSYGSALAVAATCDIGPSFLVMKLLLQSGADVNMQLDTGMYGSALIFAIENGNDQMVRFLTLDAKTDVNQQIRHGRFGSALAAAAFLGSKRCASILIEAGANVNLSIENGDFRTAMEASKRKITLADTLALRGLRVRHNAKGRRLYFGQKPNYHLRYNSHEMLRSHEMFRSYEMLRSHERREAEKLEVEELLRFHSGTDKV
ncbi:hypothetical protein GGR58DRAFT_325662 [Xylaria digitata]|nr:hypothetical protein GGR58DRAFT_325662 [Xylaria digitata]